MDADVFKMDALKKYKVILLRLRMLYSEFSASAESFFQLQYPTAPRRSTTIPDVDRNVAGKVGVSEINSQKRQGTTSLVTGLVCLRL